MANDYIIKVRAEADVTDIDRKLKYYARENEKNTKIKIKVEADEKVLDRLHEKYKLIDDDFVKIKQDIKTTFQHTDASGITKSVDKVTETFKNASGEVQKLITYIEHYKGKTKVLSSEVESSVKTFAGFNNSLDQTAKKSQVIERVVNKYKSLTGILHTITEETLANGQKIRTFVTEYEKNGQKIRETSKRVSDESGKHWQKYGEDLKEVINDETKLAEAHKKVQQVYSETNRYLTKDGREVTRTYSKDSDGTEHQKLVIEYEDKKGQKIQETTELIKLQGETWKRNGETSKTVVNDEIAQQEKLAKSVQRVYEETVKYKNAKGQTVTRTTTKDDDGTLRSTIVKEYYGELGKKIKETTEYIKEQGKAWRKNGETSKQVIDDELAREEKARSNKEKALNQLVQEKEALRKRNEEYKKQNTYTTDYKSKEKEVLDLKDKTIHKLQTETKEITNGLNETKKVTTLTDKWVDSEGMLHTKLTETTKNLKNVNGTMVETGKAITKVTENVEKSKTGLNQLGQSFSDIIVKVAKFYLASLPIRAVQNAITSAIQSVKDFDSAVTELTFKLIFIER